MTARKRDAEFRAILLEWFLGQIRDRCSGKGHFRSEDGSEKGEAQEEMASMLAAAGKNLPERFGVCARASGSWLTIAIGLVVATTMFGCSQQPAPQYQYSPPPLSRSYPSVPPPGKLEVASWYGPGFVGHVTSDGEVFNPNELTAASKTLPIGSRVRVTNPQNGRSVVVRINDRGPYVKGRNLDLSHGAAQKIGLCAEGVGHVRVRVLRRTHVKNNRPNRARDVSREHI